MAKRKPASTVNLGEFDGRTITSIKVKIMKAGDGLSQALEIEPTLMHWGEKVYVVLECDPDDMIHKPSKDSAQECGLIVKLNAAAGTIVDADLVAAAVNAQTDKIVAAREAAKGIQQLPTDEVLRIQHADGEHDDIEYVGCPVCFPEHAPKPAKRATKAVKKSPAKRAPRKATKKS